MVLKAAHTFNLLDARGAISVTERAGYIGRIRNAVARWWRRAYVDVATPARLPDAARCLARETCRRNTRKRPA